MVLSTIDTIRHNNVHMKLNHLTLNKTIYLFITNYITTVQKIVYEIAESIKTMFSKII